MEKLPISGTSVNTREICRKGDGENLYCDFRNRSGYKDRIETKSVVILITGADGDKPAA